MFVYLIFICLCFAMVFQTIYLFNESPFDTPTRKLNIINDPLFEEMGLNDIRRLINSTEGRHILS